MRQMAALQRTQSNQLGPTGLSALLTIFSGNSLNTRLGAMLLVYLCSARLSITSVVLIIVVSSESHARFTAIALVYIVPLIRMCRGHTAYHTGLLGLNIAYR